MVLINLDEIKNNKNEINDEFILYSHNFLQDRIVNALEVIKRYIIENKLLIVGGTAIDYALKLKNNTLYNDLYQVPDFDIISPNNVIHANNIGKILCELKYDNISIVPAIHKTTVRVQLLGFTLFDSTYVPEYIYNKIPYLEYNNFIFVHPNFQKINQYISLSFLYKITGPSYNILHRLKKDVERLGLLEKYYNISESTFNSTKKIFKFNLDNLIIQNIIITDKVNIFYNSIEDVPIKYLNKHIISNHISYNITSNIIFHGELAYCIIYSEFQRLYSKLYNILPLTNLDKNYIKELYKDILIHNSYQLKSNNIFFDVYNNISIVNSNGKNSKYNIESIIELLQKNNKILNLKKLDGILDLLPEYANFIINQGGKNESEFSMKIFNLYGNLVSINIIYNKEYSKYIPVTNYNYNLMYFLLNYYLEENLENKNIYLSYYKSLNAMVKIIQYIYYSYSDAFNKTESFDNSIFNYSLNTTGSTNYPDNYLHFLLNFKNLIDNNQNLNNLPPKNYIGYPNCEIKNIFDKKKSEYYSDIQNEINDLGISGINNNYYN